MARDSSFHHSFAEYVDTRLFKPLGIVVSTFDGAAVDTGESPSTSVPDTLTRQRIHYSVARCEQVGSVPGR